MQLLVGYVLLCCSLIFSKVLRNKGASQVALVVKNLPADTGDMDWSPSQEDPLEEEMATYSSILRVSLVSQLVNNPPAMQETPVRFLGQEYPLEKGKATHSSILAWRIPGTVQSMASQRVRHDWATSTFHFPVFLPGESYHGQRSVVGYSP